MLIALTIAFAVVWIITSCVLAIVTGALLRIQRELNATYEIAIHYIMVSKGMPVIPLVPGSESLNEWMTTSEKIFREDKDGNPFDEQSKESVTETGES
jgi:hypothetical protein